MKIIKKIVVLSLLSLMALNAQESKSVKSTIDVNKTTSPKVMQIAFFPLTAYNAAVVRTKIKPLLDRESKVLSFKSNNTVVLAAYPETIKRVEKVIKKLESLKPFDATVVKFNEMPIKKISKEINAMSKSLFPQDIISEKVTVIDSNATNSLIFVGKKENMDRLLKYIKLLDIEGGFTSKDLEE